MSALDDIIARDNAGPAQNAPASPLDSIIARDAAPATQPAPVPTPSAGEPPGAFTSFAAGLGHGIGTMALGAQQLLGHGASQIGLSGIGDYLTNDANSGIKNIDAQYAPYSSAHPITSGAGNLGGMIGGVAPLAALAPESVPALLQGALVGAGTNALTAVDPDKTDYWSEKLNQVGQGAVGGAAGTAVVKGLGAALGGAGGAAQKMLSNAGVALTPGQILGKTAATVEDRLTSVPVLGDFIKSAQQRSVNSFNTATYNKVLEPLGETYSGPIGNEGIAAVKAKIGAAYDNALSKMTFNANDPTFQASISRLGQMATGLPQTQQQTFMNIVKTQITDKLGPQGVMDGPTLKGVQSELSRTASNLGRDPSWDNQQLGKAIGEVKNAIDSSLPGYNAPEAVQQLQSANAAYANFVRLRAAGASQGAMNREGVFTPAQLNSAVRSSDKSVGKGAVASGQALLQDFSSAGQSVLGNKYPDSGTAGRAALELGLGGLAGHTFLPPGVMGPAVAGVGTALIPYTKLGQAVVQRLLMSRPQAAQAVGNAVGQLVAPYGATLGAALSGLLTH